MQQQASQAQAAAAAQAAAVAGHIPGIGTCHVFLHIQALLAM
jgi:hypothetical protein